MQSSTVLRFLIADAIEQAQSGHPGMPLGMADIATVLYQRFLRHHPLKPSWANRDRVVLSNGHGSMLQYAVLHLCGYALSLDDLKDFRQLGSKTPGHPEYPDVPGVETSTGPLGQGLANGVGMALAQKHLSERFNQPDHSLLDYFTYVLVGDGCLMEGISHEASALAGQWQLGHLIVMWDDNGISIDGKTDQWFSEDVCRRYRSYHWQVIELVDGHDEDAIERAIIEARQDLTRPTFIQFKTNIGHGAPNLSGKSETHGKPLGAAEIAAMRQALNWDLDPFKVSKDAYDMWDARESGERDYLAWHQLWHDYQQQYPKQAQELELIWSGDLPDAYHTTVSHLWHEWTQSTETLATRQASQRYLQQVSESVPQLMGGSADLTESNLTKVSHQIPFSSAISHGNYLHYGVREFAMFAIANGLSVSGIIPYVGTFLVFMDYGRNAMRMAAMMGLRVIFVLTHDSIGLGEDGPTHQPIEHLAIARLTPNLYVWRPADLLETAAAWHSSIQRQSGPSAIILSRQKTPALAHVEPHVEAIGFGGYVVQESKSTAMDCLLVATGTEVALACEVASLLETEGLSVRVVSMPCMELFLTQSQEYRKKILGDFSCVVVIEAAARALWERCLDRVDLFFGVESYGQSAPAADLFEHFGLTSGQIADKILSQRQVL